MNKLNAGLIIKRQIPDGAEAYFKAFQQAELDGTLFTAVGEAQRRVYGVSPVAMVAILLVEPTVVDRYADDYNNPGFKELCPDAQAMCKDIGFKGLLPGVMGVDIKPHLHSNWSNDYKADFIYPIIDLLIAAQPAEKDQILIEAIKGNNADAVEYCLNKGIQASSAYDKEGNTAFQHALQNFTMSSYWIENIDPAETGKLAEAKEGYARSLAILEKVMDAGVIVQSPAVNLSHIRAAVTALKDAATEHAPAETLTSLQRRITAVSVMETCVMYDRKRAKEEEAQSTKTGAIIQAALSLA